MEEALLEIIAALDEGETVDAVWLDKLVRRYNRAAHDGTRQVAKRRLLPYYLRVRSEEPERWAAWNVAPETDAAIVRLLQAKPRRTASGVATITVLTKPWPCSGSCVFCPSDIRMPKSYLSDEPACQRAERCWFDPYLQVTARLRALTDMGHVTDKVELIVLGGTWSDYPEAYQRWFIGELFRALNASDEERARTAAERRAWHETQGLPRERNELAEAAADIQQRINAGELTYNEAWGIVYGDRTLCGHDSAALSHPEILTEDRRADRGLPLRNDGERDLSWDALFALHRANEGAAKRVVGLVVETRPDLVTEQSCRTLRALGCTKVQIGIQSLNDDLLAANGRAITSARIAQAMALLRRYGFKNHIHFMVNLLGATPEGDLADYRRLITDPAFLPDEVKLYPCCLVESAHLTDCFEAGRWRPYTEEELVGVLVADVLATPPWTRISRMIRDISATDILAGNKKTNLRQIVEAAVEEAGEPIREIRSREISVEGAEVENLALETIVYQTATTEEHFLQWVTPAGKIAGFCRLSLPDWAAVEQCPDAPEAPHLPEDACGLPVPGEAMIREVHVYGKVAALHTTGEGTQHLGLGRKLVEEACTQARAAGYAALNVISAVGTRAYYRSLGFEDAGPYQKRPLS
ncbi:tRNA uridine(34) 5-carboxymethylaminomethyl modification radical SAM/GNAT enzyme Elp3 [Adlercreutzia sp. R25]|uniref:elongator complex protein 3 n=1 Tax=Adlercreutzia shanghongiae TaxID=3111773 RepID=UPI002DBD9E10|nr:tRNA uridine(34) 5-carboxymethylaminomethyl modification radical SAM/GNAT enzyme Elp3 [Adlercreutzia sp. R25]MEC4272816.1 tRNA uridine(34) 5-carboxymethylaminomethyl modification radical SAM/GNAT enzyme Elp3 [Adlercreutzia sp. R25]